MRPFRDVGGRARARVRWTPRRVSSIGPLEAMVERFHERPRPRRGRAPAGRARARTARIVAILPPDVPGDLAEACVRLEGLPTALDVVHVATTASVAPADAAAAYWAALEIVDFTWLRAALDGAASEDRWERRAAESLVAELDELRRDLTRQLLAGSGEVQAPGRDLRLRHAAALERTSGPQDDLRQRRTVTLAAIMVLVRELGRLEEAP